MPEVSVIIPAYNAMAYLPQTVQSVLEQTFIDFEVIIVDDGSTDETAQWSATHSDARVKLFSQSNQGASVARNAGIVQATGKYIALLDADDLWTSDKLEKQVRCMETDSNVGLVHCWINFIDDQGKITGSMKTHGKGEVWSQVAVYNPVRCCSTPLVRRECFDKVGVFDSTLRSSDDWDMWIRIAAEYPFAVLDEPLVYYRQHPENGSKDYAARLPNYLLTIEKAFRSAPPELQHLKNRSLGHVHLHVAWRALLFAKNYKEAARYRREALSHYPGLHYNKNCIRLGLTIAKLRWLG